MLLMIDNYDSFTYNLVQFLGELGQEQKVVRNDEITCEDIKTLNPKYIVISPGPGRPEQAGISKTVIETFGKDIPTLGVCLGHQSIGEVFGGKTIHAPELVHGKTSPVRHDNKTLFKDLPNPLIATRYHSLVVDPTTISDELEISATLEDSDVIMGIRHKTYPIEGVQFHPESILTQEGKSLLGNFLATYK